jgi:hypothetical protein
MSAVLFLNLAQKWEKIIKFWSKSEKPFLVKPYTALKNKGTLKKRIVNISITIFAMAACKQIQFLSLCIIFIGLVIFFYPSGTYPVFVFISQPNIFCRRKM